MQLDALTSIPIYQIISIDRLRAVDTARVDALATSIADIGLQQPITVLTLINDQYQLIAGAHRLAAMRQLSWETVPALLMRAKDVANTELEARLAEIDENLIRHELNALDRATALAERKAVYEQLFPETKNGAQGGHDKQCNNSSVMSFAEATAREIKCSGRTIQRCIKVHHNIPAELRAKIVGTWLAGKMSDLLKVAQQPAEMQERIVSVIRSDDSIRNVDDALALIHEVARKKPRSIDDRLYDHLLGAWIEATPAARSRALQWIQQQTHEGNEFGVPEGWEQGI